MVKTNKTKGESSSSKMVTSEKKPSTDLVKFIEDVSKSSSTKQIVIGTASGWVSGFLTMKIGKIAAVAVGGSIILLQVASHKGYINVNWDKIQRHADKVTDRIEKEVTGQSPSTMDKIMAFSKSNQWFTAGFAGGFLIGLSFA